MSFTTKTEAFPLVVNIGRRVNGLRKKFVNFLIELCVKTGFLSLTLSLRPELAKRLQPARLFVANPDTEKTADFFTPGWFRRKFMRNRPWIGNVYKMNGRWCITAFIYSLPEEFEDKERLRVIRDSSYELQKRIGAPEISFAGILPSRMKKFGVRTGEFLETEITAQCVLRAIKKIRKDHMVILLGGNGHTGGYVDALLAKNGIPRIIVDLPKNGNVADVAWPERGGTPWLVLNLISGKDLEYYLPLLRKGDLILNEAYSADIKKIGRKATGRGLRMLHIAGVETEFCLFPFPGLYSGKGKESSGFLQRVKRASTFWKNRSVPCCGSLIFDDMKVVVVEL